MDKLFIKNKPINKFFLGEILLGSQIFLGVEKADHTYGTLYNNAEDVNGILSGFNKQTETQNGYFVPNFTFPSEFGISYELMLCAKVDEPLDNYLWFISNNDGFNSYIGPHITMGGTNPIAKENAISLGFEDQLDLSKKLFYKFSFNGISTYTLSVSDNPEFKNALTKSYENPYLLPSSPIAFGSKFGTEPMNGYIDLHYCYYKETNRIVWRGTGAETSYNLTLKTDVENCNVVFIVNGEEKQPTSSTSTSFTVKTKFNDVISYTISKEGYDTKTGSIQHLTSDTTIDISMILTTHYFTVNTNVDDCNVVFHINGQDLAPTTSTSNSYTIATKWYDSFTYTVSKEDYYTINGVVESLYEDKSEDVSLDLTALILTLNTNVEGCSVVFHYDGQDFTPTQMSETCFTLTTQWKGEISYTVSKDDYETVNGSVFHMLEDTSVNVEMNLTTLNLTVVTNVTDCTVVFHVNGQDLAPTSVVDNKYNLATKWKGEISYTVSKPDYVTVNNSLERLYEDTSINANLVLVSYTLTLNTNVADCNVVFTFDGEDHTPTTIESNKYTLTTNYRGAIAYTVSKEGYYTITNTIQTLTADSSVDLALVLITHTLTLNTNVDNCNVIFTFDGEDHTPTSFTSNSYSITAKENTAITYKVSKTDYVTVEDSIDSLNEDKFINVTLEPKIYIQQIYDASGNLVSIDSLNTITDIQFIFAENYNKVLSGELKPFPTTEVKGAGLYNAFSNCTGLTGSVSFPNLTSINNEGLYNAFSDCTRITSVSFPNLNSIGDYGLQNAFHYCKGITGSVSFPNLTTVGDTGLQNAFHYCTGITEVHFKSSMSGDSQCTASNMGCTNATVYFDLP